MVLKYLTWLNQSARHGLTSVSFTYILFAITVHLNIESLSKITERKSVSTIFVSACMYAWIRTSVCACVHACVCVHA